MDDPAGGALPSASVELIDEGTGSSRTTLTNEVGEYSFSAVKPSTYSIVAGAPGFKQMAQIGVVVATQTNVTVDMVLEIGAVTESVNVTAEAAQLQTADASTGQVIDTQKLIDLPNLGRNPFILSKLTESVVQVGNPKFNRMQDQSGSSQISVAGGPVRGNNYTLDGVSITDSTNRAVIIPTQEAVQEVKVQANTYDAEMGRTGGGTFNTTLRSGTNQLHFAAFGYLRQTEWVANGFFSNRAGQERAYQPYKNYGGSVSGPIRIPGLYDGLNKTFFFISGEAYRQYDASGTRLSVPSELERFGDFSQSLATSGTGGPQIIYDPLTTAADGTRSPFPGNVIPASRISPIGLALASYYPTPNGTAANYGAPNFSSTVNAFNRADQTTWKIDHEFTSWWRASASYLHYGSQEPGNRWFPDQIASPNQNVLHRKVDATQINSTFLVSPTFIVTARYGFNRFPNFSAPLSVGFDIQKLGFSEYLTTQSVFPAFPSITMGTLQNYGGGGTSQSVFHSKSLNITASKFVGNHNVKFGFDYRLIHHDGAPRFGAYSFGFTDVFTRATPQKAVLGTGADLATMLLGYPTSGNIEKATNFYNYVNYYGWFIQDDYRITPQLTLNFGLRLEHETGPADTNNNFIVGFDGTSPSPLNVDVLGRPVTGQVLYAGQNGNPTSTYDPITIKWGPRFGFAYSMTPKTVIRGGYGIFWAPTSFSFQSTLGYSQQTPIVSSFDNNFTPAATLANPFPNGFIDPAGNSLGGLAGIGQDVNTPDLNMRSGGYVQQYSLDVQKELPGSFVLSFGYIGSRGLGLQQDNRNLNQLNPAFFGLGDQLNEKVANPFYQNGGQLSVGSPTIALSRLLTPYPQFDDVIIEPMGTNRSLYNSAYVKAQRRLANGFTALVTYTWSRSMDQGFGTTANNFSRSPTGPQNAYNIDAEYSLSTQNTPHRLSMAFTYELPVGEGKPFVNSSPLLDYIVGGWSLNVVSVLQSGYPLAISQSNSNSVIGAGAQRPNATGESPEVDAPFAQRLDGWINRAAFATADQYTFGNVSRVIGMRGPGQVNFDVSIFKTFDIGERLQAQFRAEALNATNTPMFYAPNTTSTSGSFGIITSQANYPRLIQLGARFMF